MRMTYRTVTVFVQYMVVEPVDKEVYICIAQYVCTTTGILDRWDSAQAHTVEACGIKQINVFVYKISLNVQWNPKLYQKTLQWKFNTFKITVALSKTASPSALLPCWQPSPPPSSLSLSFLPARNQTELDPSPVRSIRSTESRITTSRRTRERKKERPYLCRRGSSSCQVCVTYFASCVFSWHAPKFVLDIAGLGRVVAHILRNSSPSPPPQLFLTQILALCIYIRIYILHTQRATKAWTKKYRSSTQEVSVLIKWIDDTTGCVL